MSPATVADVPAGPSSKPKRHHYVPQAYLARFGRDRQIAVRRRGRPGHYVTNVKNVALETNFYQTTKADGQTSVEVETWLAEVDGMADQAIADVLAAGEPPRPGTPERFNLAAVLAIQMTRTPETRERVLFTDRLATYANGDEVSLDLVRRFLAEKHLGFDPRDGEVQGAFDMYHASHSMSGGEVTKDDAINVALRTAPDVAVPLAMKRWTLEVARKPKFMTSDSPLVLWRPRTPRDAFEGVGIKTAHEIRFPLDAGHQLVLVDLENVRPTTVRVEPDRVRQCNADLASACHTLIVGHPDRTRQLTELKLARRRPVLRFNTGPLYERNRDGEDVYTGEVLHAWVQRHDQVGA
ncbi:DUF4238 domain-containing protein [Micromonospora aurantiaca (nom. illeg.)]|uniref:DUF4238 domain-containing protein n=1 Tax=Micromonospora aurantiaca (nom. illeg.) TaxID=47850 RepID=UPI0008277E98|nr:DUF4238 domain-containing protein [Micromonospora aurantiaca]SCL35800.1 Protein of unknown function [Micromonospora aurantiaca]